MCIRDRFGPVPVVDLDEVPDDANVAFIAGIGAPGVLIEKPVSYTHSDAADERSSVDLGGRRIIKKKNTVLQRTCQARYI